MALKNTTEKDDKTVYNLVYDKEKAKELKIKCDAEFAEDYADELKDTRKEHKIFKVCSVVCFVFCILSATALILSIKNSVTAGIVASGIVLALSVIGFILFALLCSCEKEWIRKVTRDYKFNRNGYAYPILVQFYNLVGEGEVLSVNVSDYQTSATFRFTYKTEGGEIVYNSFSMRAVRAYDVTKTEIDLAEVVIRFPERIWDRNFEIVDKKESKEENND